MLTLFFGLLLAALALMAVSLQKAYSHIPTAELKRRARRGDDYANLLYRAAAYGSTTEVLLWIIIGLSAGGFFIVVANNTPTWFALSSSVALLWVGFAWLPNSTLGVGGRMIAKYLTGPFTWLLAKLYPVLSRLAMWFGQHGHITVHTGVYQKEDLLALLERQKTQPDNHISHDELKIVAGALTFGDKLVRDVMTPRRTVKTIAAADSVGPHLLDELHSISSSLCN